MLLSLMKKEKHVLELKVTGESQELLLFEQKIEAQGLMRHFLSVLRVLRIRF